MTIKESTILEDGATFSNVETIILSDKAFEKLEQILAESEAAGPPAALVELLARPSRWS